MLCVLGVHFIKENIDINLIEGQLEYLPIFFEGGFNKTFILHNKGARGGSSGHSQISMMLKINCIKTGGIREHYI